MDRQKTKKGHISRLSDEKQMTIDDLCFYVVIEMETKKTERKGNIHNLTGRRFGKLTVLSITEKRMDSGSVVWLCRCDCGNVADVSARRLVRGKVKSCGCLSAPPPKNYIGKKFGRLTVTEYIGRKRKITENSKRTDTYWRCLCECGNTVDVAQAGLQSGSTQSCGCLQKERARKALKLCDGTSAAIIQRTQAKKRSNNSSGYTGVYYDRYTEKWQAYISFKKKRYWLGRYTELKDAIAVRKQAEEKLFDSFLAWYDTFLS